MKRIKALGWLIIYLPLVNASSTIAWSSANQAYNQGNLAVLSQLSQTYPNDTVITYLNAAANLSRTNPTAALEFVQNNSTDFFRTDLDHQLLSYYFNNQAWDSYLNIYMQMESSQVNTNETCGYDIANFALNKHQAIQSDFNYLLANKMPLWCISLIASKLNNKSLDKKLLTPFLYNLINNDQTFQFNQLADNLNYSKVSFSSGNSANKYQTVYRISNLAVKDPEQAYNEIAKANVDQSTKEYLYNQIAANLAIKQYFQDALAAIENGNNDFLSDDEYEWRVRTYLAVSNWSQVYATINAMPTKLQNKSAWLYWKAYAAGKLGQKTTAQETLQKIPVNYNYYSLLAQSELRAPLNPQNTLSQKRITPSEDTKDIQLSFDLYQVGKQINSNNFARLATQSLKYIINSANDSDIAAISKKAMDLGWTEMSIYAANNLTQQDASLSFPLMFSQQYKKYSQSNGIDMSFSMAITRQESRFNRNALAFDGGVGLMQIMPTTASYIAKKTGSDNCYKNYECNIKFGSWYLGHLSSKFGNNLIYTSAGYNAGPGRAHRWQQAFQNMDNRVQIELIPFKITRDYVQKVLTNKVVYDARLNNSPKVDILKYLNQINKQDRTFIVDDDNNSGDSSGQNQ
jgi:soluble lytic murein transglycosylase